MPGPRKKTLPPLRKFDDVANIRKHIDEYFEHRESLERIPTIESLCVWLGIDRVSFLSYEQKEGEEEFFKVITSAKDRILSELVDSSLDSKNSTLRMFLLRNNHGYRNQQEVKFSDNFDIEF